jgi:hypothetical protein
MLQWYTSSLQQSFKVIVVTVWWKPLQT